MQTGDVINNTHLLSHAECGPQNSGYFSQDWTLELTSDGYVQFVNHWNNDNLYVTDQTGYVERGPANASAPSQDWTLVPVN